MMHPDDIKEYIKQGKEAGHKYLIIACDEFDYEDYPIWVDSVEEVDKKRAELDAGVMANYHFIFDLSIEDYSDSKKRYWLDRIEEIGNPTI
jgi:hypothetical protein